MNPRRIGHVMQALDALDIPQYRIVGHTEKEIEELAFPTILSMCKYDWLWVVSDDAIVRPYALAAVRALMRKHPVVTGYSQRTHDNWVVNLSKSPLRAPHPSVDAYDFLTYAEVVSYPDEAVPTWFAGMSLTGMSTEMWARFPFGCYGGAGRDGNTGYSSDFFLSYRLQENQIPIVAAREGF